MDPPGVGGTRRQFTLGRSATSLATLPTGRERPRAKAQVPGLIPAALLLMRAPVRRPRPLLRRRFRSPSNRRPAAGRRLRRAEGPQGARLAHRLLGGLDQRRPRLGGSLL